MTTTKEFQSNRDLIDEDFEGYKLSLKQIQKAELSLKLNLNIVTPNNDQYSYKHAKLFSLHNFLYHDAENNSNYYLSNSANPNFVNVIERNAFGDSFEEPEEIWQIPLSNQQQSYNCSLIFASNDIAVIGDGAETLFILDTGERKQKYNWSVLVKETFDFPFVIRQAELFSEEKELHCLLNHVVYEDNKHKWLVAWVIYCQNEAGDWKQKYIEKYRSSGDLFGSCFSSNKEVWIASENGFSNSTVKEENYNWSQKDNVVNIKLNTDEINVDVYTESNYICVKTEIATLLEGTLYDKIEPSLTKWEHIDNCLDIKIFKIEEGKYWPKLVSDDNLDKEGVKIIPETESILNPTQMEECDFPDSTSNILECFSRESLKKRVNLGSHRVFFDVTEEGKNRAFAIQQDEHLIIWNVDSETHCGTLMAMGYIQASKQRKKFVSCSPNLNYSVVCESSGHLFIYRHNVLVNESDLRNRTSGKRIKKISQQQVVNFNDQDVVGIHCGDDVLYVLTRNVLHAFFMKQD